MITRILVASTLAASLMVTAANAVTVVNSDRTTHHIIVQPKDGHMMRYTLAGHQHRSLDCKPGSTLKLGKESQTCDAKISKIFIKAGKFSI